MGRTVPTFNMYLDREITGWAQFRRALRAEDQPVFDRLFSYARRHMAESAAAARPVPFDALLISVLLEQQKEIEELRRRLGREEESRQNGTRPDVTLPLAGYHTVDELRE